MPIARVPMRLSPRGSGSAVSVCVRTCARTRARTRQCVSTVEPLETRRLFATVSWDGGPGGTGFDWNTPVNWSNDTIPTANDDVVISSASFGFVSVGSAPAANVARSVNCAVTLRIESAGALNISNASSVNNLFLAGAIGGSGDVTVSGLFTWIGGQMRGTGRLVLPALSIGTVNPGTGGAVTLARAIDNSGDLTLERGTFNMSFGASEVGTINNLAGGTFEVADVTGINSNVAGAAIHNAGQMIKSTTTTTIIQGSAGGGTLSLDNQAGGTVEIRQGALVFSLGGSFANAGATTLSTGTTLFVPTSLDGGGTLAVQDLGVVQVARLRQASVTLNGGSSLTLPANGASSNVSVLGSLSMSNAASFDLNDNDLMIDYPVAGPSPLAQVQTLINTARGNGTWNGATGLKSTSAKNAAQHNVTLGAMEATDFKTLNGAAATFDGLPPLDNSAALIKFTYYGDANFSGRVTFDDYVRIDLGFGQHLTGWANGDFNGSGVVNFDDYVLIDTAFNTQSATLGRAAASLSNSGEGETPLRERL